MRVPFVGRRRECVRRSGKNPLAMKMVEDTDLSGEACVSWDTCVKWGGRSIGRFFVRSKPTLKRIFLFCEVFPVQVCVFRPFFRPFYAAPERSGASFPTIAVSPETDTAVPKVSLAAKSDGASFVISPQLFSPPWLRSKTYAKPERKAA